MIADVESRFWTKVDKSGGEAACWPWTAAKKRGGRALPYGFFGAGGRTRLAHRVAYEIAHGTVPSGLCVLHRCDNASCCNPAHLFIGTQAENVRDKCAKGRQARGAASARKRICLGEAHQNAVLTEQKVREIRARRADGELFREIAAAYGVSSTTVRGIAHGLSWGHVNG